MNNYQTFIEQPKNDQFMMNNGYNPKQQEPWQSNIKDGELVTNPVACDLRDIILYYQSQPDLLKLILMSKVEEDKRRAEEAKLRAKELDLMLYEHQQQQQQQQAFPQPQQHQHILQSSFDNRRPSAIDLLFDDNDCDRRDSALGSSFDGSSNSNDELDDRNTFSPNSNSPSAAAAAAASILSLGFPPQQQAMMTTNQKNALHPLSPPFHFGQDQQQQQISYQMNKLEHRSSFSSRYEPSFLPPKSRRRREMQAISKIVETRENPYNDGYFWKNNGNTIQKKTGNKSIYYKCSNSTKGCPVNKTVTAKENGEYLIKYRGEHLPDCGKVQRIVDM
ncbi:hypothetical protein G6F68_007419 [Rhizopus microsporus]|nr:hypothetical protein G6F67_007782 [Rhizopus microsporus]KAG1260482.1 hypothetical protein G6F68_007419 [Rhizopus microsporus]